MKKMIMTACSIDLNESLELYCLNRLGPEDTRRFGRHLANCPICLEEVLETDMFLESLRTALREIRVGGELREEVG